MSSHTLDSVSWFGEKPSFPIEGLQCSRKRKVLSNGIHRFDAFPPPLESLTVCDGQFSHLSQVDRVCFMSVRRDGRLILAEKPQSLPPQRRIQSQRSDGRLQLRLYVDETQGNWQKQVNRIAESSFLQHDRQHYPRNVQTQHDSNAEVRHSRHAENDQLCWHRRQNRESKVSLSKHRPHAENALHLPRQHSLPDPIKSDKVLAERHEHSLIAMHALQERCNKITTQTSSRAHPWHVLRHGTSSFFQEQDPPSQVANNWMDESGEQIKPSAEATRCNPLAEFGRKRDPEAENAAMCTVHQQQSPKKRIGSSSYRPNADMKREIVSPNRESAKTKNPNAEIASSVAETMSKIGVTQMGRPLAVRETILATKSRAKKAKTREEKARQENASARTARLIGEYPSLGRPARPARWDDASLSQAFQPYDLSFLTRAAFLNNSLIRGSDLCAC